MELPDFKKNVKMNALREQMDAPYINIFNGRWYKADLSEFLSELLAKKEVSVDFDQITVEGDESFSIGGQRVFTYVKRQRGGGKYKFHIANCATLKGAKNSQVFGKYVASIDVSGVFKVDIIYGDNVYYDQEVELSVCRKCLQTLNYEGYRKASPWGRDQIYKSFEIERFLTDKKALIDKPRVNSKGFSKKFNRYQTVVSAKNQKNVTGSQDRAALVIGCKAYPKDWELRNSANDANAIGDKLQSLGFEVFPLVDCRYSEMMESISSFSSMAEGKQAILFYFAGHGIQFEGKNYLLAVDSDIHDRNSLLESTISVEKIMVELCKSSKVQKILILDACRSKPKNRSLERAMTGIGLAKMEAATNCFVSFSTAPGSVASDGNKENGLYTGELLKEIGKPGLPIGEVFQNVRQRVSHASMRRQIPWDTSSLESNFFFHQQ